MDAMIWATCAVFAVTTVWVFRRTGQFYRSMDAGPRTRRLLSQRMITAGGYWEISLGAVMIASPDMGWSNAISVIGLGLLMVGASRFWRKVGLPS